MRGTRQSKANHFLIVLICLTQCVPSFIFSAVAPLPQGELRMGRTGTWNKDHNAVYFELTKAVQKWIENLEPVAVRVSLDGSSLPAKSVEYDRQRADLSKLSQDLKTALFQGMASSSLQILREKLVDSRKRASSYPDLGPQIQESLLVEGAYYWNLGNKKSSRSLIERAIRIHPHGVLPTFAEWDQNNTNFNTEAFDGFIHQIRAQTVRNCLMVIETTPSKVQLKINGFQLENSQEVALASGFQHHLEVTQDGFLGQKRKVSCLGPERRKWRFHLAKRVPVHEFEREIDETILSSQKSKSMILIEPEKEHFKLFLYTPGKYLDEIPLSQPIKLAEVQQGNVMEQSPLVSDAIVSLFDKHQLLASDLRLNDQDFVQIPSPFRGEMALARTEKRWIDSPVFWGIVGGILVGGAITYFANRKQSSTATSEDWE